jgi:hypothetical protein
MAESNLHNIHMEAFVADGASSFDGLSILVKTLFLRMLTSSFSGPTPDSGVDSEDFEAADTGGDTSDCDMVVPCPPISLE